MAKKLPYDPHHHYQQDKDEMGSNDGCIEIEKDNR